MQRATLTDVPLPDGTRVALEVERTALAPRVLVDGVPVRDLLEGAGWSAWRGRVAGVADSDVALGVSLHGCHGWLRVGDVLWHLVSRPAPGGDWTRAEARFVSDAELARRGLRAPACGAEQLGPSSSRPAPTAPLDAAAPGLAPTYELRVAVETDHQYYLVFGDVNAAAVYATTLFAWVSALYEAQVGVVFTLPYLQFYTTPNDPWTTPDIGGDCVAMLYELQSAWASNVPAGADIGHFLSGANLGCGAGFIGGLCSATQNFSVSGNQNGQTPFPVTPNNANLDFYAVSHELGHNFGAIHTHAYCPPLDECAPAGYFGPCQTQQQCAYPGTLMSYCYVCGGFSNIDTVFHAESAADMRAHVKAGACLPNWCPPSAAYCAALPSSAGCVPSIYTSGTPTLSGPDDFHVLASDVGAHQNGLLFFGLGEASIPIGAGTVCILPPFVRTGVIASGGGAQACSGLFDFHWSQGFTAVHALAVGTTVHAQYWYRDPPSAAGSALTNAVRFTFCQ